MVIEPVAESPIFIAEAEKMAPEPERVIVNDPVANALDATEVGVAVKFAKVPPTAATVTAATAAAERRIFVNVLFFNMHVPFWEEWTRRASEPAEWVQGISAYEFRRSAGSGRAPSFSAGA
jgi:hypothetical protein